MSNELITLQNELKIAKQQNEINELRYNLQVTQAKKASRLEDSLFSPDLYEHYQKVAMMMSKSEIVPKAYRGKPADIMIAMEMGYQLGFPIAQFLQDIAVINGRPCLWGDGLLAVVLSHPDCENIKEDPLLDDKGNVVGYKCIVKRKGFEPREQIFTLADAKSAKLLDRDGPWKSYPRRMLQMRARAFALRDVFGDALRGIRVAEEQQDSDIIEAETIACSPAESPKNGTEKLKQILDISDAKVEEETENFKKILDATDERVDKILTLVSEVELSEERFEKALEHYNVSCLDELNYEQQDSFIEFLEKIKNNQG